MRFSLSKEQVPSSQFTKLSRFMARTLESIPSLVFPWPKSWQPSGMVASAASMSATVQLIRSPTTLVAPTAVRMVKELKIW